MVTLESVAALVGRAVDEVELLDRRTLRSAFSGEVVHRMVVRDRVSGDVLTVTVDDEGRAVDAAARRRRDREAAAEYEQVLGSDLVALLCRHPSLADLRVRVTRTGREDAADEVLEVPSVAALISLAGEPGTTRLELVEEPVVLDED